MLKTQALDEAPENPLILISIAYSEMARLPGISAAGSNPELTPYTPPGDAEFVELGELLSSPELPMAPSGAPTPAVMTRAVRLLLDTPVLFAGAGLPVKPRIPYFEMGGTPGRDFREEPAVPDAQKLYERGTVLGRHLGRLSDFIVLGECMPAGTTTAQAVLNAIGYGDRVSSSLPDNPLGLKQEMIQEAMREHDVAPGGLRDRPLEAIRLFGDPMMPVSLGIIEGLADRAARIVLGGGTQMAAILALAHHHGIEADISVATTRYVAEDETADFKSLMSSLEYPYTVCDPGFRDSEVPGLLMYEEGEVKEGVAAGGALYLAALNQVSQRTLRERVEDIYSTFSSELL